MVAATSVPLTKKQQDIFVQYYRSVQNNGNTSRDDFRGRLQYIDRVYMREIDRTIEEQRAERANRQGDSTRFNNMTVPVVEPQIETAVAHQTAVFLTSMPLFPVVADPQFMDQALQLETLIENDSIRGGWAREFMMFFRDGYKYNFAPIEIDWSRETTYSVVSDPTVTTTEGVPKKVVWTGNQVHRWDPYNSFFDSRVTPSQIYTEGEYAGRTKIMSRIELKSLISRLPDVVISNVRPAFESGRGGLTSATSASGFNYYVPDINPLVSGTNYKAGGTNWLQWAGLSSRNDNGIIYHDAYEVTKFYCKILPSDFGLRVPNANTPQIYKLIIVNHEWIIYAELQTNAHGMIPVFVGQPKEDGLDYQTKSMATDSTPFQNLASAYTNSIIASRRRAISDRVLYDPSRIDRSQINSANPSAKIPVKPAAYGKPLQEAAYAFPYREDQQAASMSQVQTILALSNQLVGQNPVNQGQFIKGNKTDGQFDTVMDNSGARDQMASIQLEYQIMVPLKEILKINYLQFAASTTLYNRNRQAEVEIDPVQLRAATMEFMITDGLIPADTVISAEAYATAIQVIGSSPELAGAYNLGPMFSYLSKTQGADLSPFEKSPEQIAYEQALQAWQSTVQMILEKGGTADNLPPQPLPAAFNFEPDAPAETSNEGSAGAVAALAPPPATPVAATGA